MQDVSAAKSSCVRVGLVSEAGSYSEGAARQLLAPLVRDASFICQSFSTCEELFKAVASGSVMCGLVPIESTLGGSKHPNYDLLLQHSTVTILAEVDFEVRCCLLALPGSTLADIKKVLSHESLLQPCDDYLRTLGVATESRQDLDSAVELREQNLQDHAAIGSNLCAERHGLQILADGIQGAEKNFTRSLLISSESCQIAYPANVAMKTSIVFWLPQATDSLFKVLAVFSLRDINLTKMESRPVPAAYLKKFAGDAESDPNNASLTSKEKQKYEYFCYIDVLEHQQSQRMEAALKHLREITPFVRVLGCYPTEVNDAEDLCKALVAASVRPESMKIASGPQLRIAILGFGNFGQFLAKEFVKRHQVFATSRGDYTADAKALGCTFVPWASRDDLFSIHNCDVLLISTSITSFRSVVASLPMELLREKKVLVTEVCSVKAFPKSVMLELLPEECDIVCTHPMFGPESGKHGWYGLPFVFDVVRASAWERARAFVAIFEEARCRMVCMSCEEHDQHAAASQFLTHFTGRALASHGCASTSVDLKSFKSLCKVVDTTCKDSFDLFYGLFKYNPSSEETITKLKQAFGDIEKRLRFRRENSMQHVAAAWPQETEGGELRVASIVSGIEESKTAAIFGLSKKLQEAGEKINSALCIGEPDYPPPQCVLDAIEQAAEEGHTHYTVVQGELELRQEICKYLREQKNVAYEPADICVSNGGKQAIYQALMAVCEDGDEILVPTPCWVSYHDIARLCGATPVPIVTTAEDGYLLSADQLASALAKSGPKCKAVILCNPSNPTGAVLSHAELEALAEVLRRPEFAHVYVVSDEIYEQLVFDTPHSCFSSLQGMRAKTLLIGGFSKGYAMTGLRLGYLAAERHVTAAAIKLQGQITSCASSISQRAGIVALRSVTPDWTKARIEELRAKRDFVVGRLRSFPGVTCAMPQGAFYVFVDLSGVLSQKTSRCNSGEGFCKTLLEKFKVALVPGEAFHAPMSCRISYACAMEDLKSAMDAFQACVAFVSGS